MMYVSKCDMHCLEFGKIFVKKQNFSLFQSLGTKLSLNCIWQC